MCCGVMVCGHHGCGRHGLPCGNVSLTGKHATGFRILVCWNQWSVTDINLQQLAFTIAYKPECNIWQVQQPTVVVLWSRLGVDVKVTLKCQTCCTVQSSDINSKTVPHPFTIHYQHDYISERFKAEVFAGMDAPLVAKQQKQSTEGKSKWNKNKIKQTNVLKWHSGYRLKCGIFVTKVLQLIMNKI